MCMYGFYSTRTSVIRRQLDQMTSALIVITDTGRLIFLQRVTCAGLMKAIELRPLAGSLRIVRDRRSENQGHSLDRGLLGISKIPFLSYLYL